MISAISILNFLSHKDTHLEFSPGVNIIVGPTDSGKSAIIKALKWVIHNRPLGDGMKSSWGGGTGVSVIVDGKSVDRVKNSKNSYFIDDLRFDAVKGDVPVEVVKALNLSEINLQTQFDSHFLLSKSSGEVAQYFNKVAHLDRIDVALQNIQRWGKDVTKKIEYNEQAIITARDRLNTYGCLDSIEKVLLALEEKEIARERKEIAYKSLLKICDQIQSVEEELQEVGFLEELEASVDYLLGVFSELKEVQNNFTILLAKVAAINAVDKLIKDTDEKLATYEEEFHEALGEGSICPLCGSVIE